MPSDLIVNQAAFLGPPPPQTAAQLHKLMEVQEAIPKWWEVGAAEYRRMREDGETPLPKPIHLPEFKEESVPSRDAGRNIPLRVVHPAAGDDGSSQRDSPGGVYFHIHGGGWTLMNEASQDPFLKAIADGTGLVVVSVGYRLAPEHPFPAGPDDCYDVAEYLIDNAAKKYGGDLKFVGGESAGGHLGALVVLKMLQTRPAFRFRGAVLNYGVFNLSTRFPSERQFKLPLVLTPEITLKYLDVFLPAPNHTAEARAHPSISPFYAELFKLDDKTLEGKGAEGLPPALFVCGTLDPLLDDTMMMATRWNMGGAEAETRIWRGMPHGFNLFPKDVLPESGECMEVSCAWIRHHL